MVVSKTFIVTCGLLAFLLLAEGCTYVKKKKRSTLHNYPIFKDMECPTDMENYDEEYVEKRAAELNMRPVDYLHKYNKMRYKPVNKNRNVGFTNDSSEK
tara:strand:- start:18865 stop:19161 length:297 start_codon:yes stop_codon:yes gene_type:complete